MDVSPDNLSLSSESRVLSTFLGGEETESPSSTLNLKSSFPNVQYRDPKGGVRAYIFRSRLIVGA